MKNQALFSSKDKIKKLKCRLLQFLIGALRAKTIMVITLSVPTFRWMDGELAILHPF